MALKIWSYPGNPRVFKALIAAEFTGAKIEQPPFQFGVTNKTPDFQKLNPLGKVPVLETPHGAIFESNAIARYVARLAEKGLFGKTLIDTAHVEQWIDFSANELERHIAAILGPRLGYGVPNKEAEAAAFKNLERGLGALNTHLATSTFLVGHGPTLADIIVTCVLMPGIRYVFTPEFSKPFPHVIRYFFTTANQPQFKNVLGEVKQAEKLVEFGSSPPAAPQPEPRKAETPKKGKKEKKKEAAAAQEGVKEAAAPATPPPAAEEEEEEKPKPKARNPLDLLPPSTMVMDEWKRLYSNTKAKEFKEVALKGFWKMYDPEGYSLWFCDYKYNSENLVPFVTMNKVSGFLQRMDVVRKHGFAKMAILGKSPFTIKGVWLFRGSEVPKVVVDECYDAELYDWTKVDTNDEKQKALVNDLFEEPDEIDGLELVECKCFK